MSIAIAEPQTLAWTREEYYRLAEEGWFGDRRVELIEGEILEMPAFRNEHCISTSCTVAALEKAFGAGHWVRCQMPLDLLALSSPEPDVAAVPGTPRDYLTLGHPKTALLVVEVSDTTLAYDRDLKACLYAAEGIKDYWVVDLVHHRPEVFRRPIADNASPHGHRYSDTDVLRSSDTVTPLSASKSPVAVADLLP